MCIRDSPAAGRADDVQLYAGGRRKTLAAVQALPEGVPRQSGQFRILQRPVQELSLIHILIIVPDQPVQPLQTPEKDTLLFPQQFVHQKRIVRSACGPRCV